VYYLIVIYSTIADHTHLECFVETGSGPVLKFFKSTNTITVPTTSNPLLLNLDRDIVEVTCGEIIDLMVKLPRRMDILIKLFIN